MERCRVCGEKDNGGKLHGGICLECQVSIMQEGFRRRRGGGGREDHEKPAVPSKKAD